MEENSCRGGDNRAVNVPVEHDLGNRFERLVGQRRRHRVTLAGGMGKTEMKAKKPKRRGGEVWRRSPMVMVKKKRGIPRNPRGWGRELAEGRNISKRRKPGICALGGSEGTQKGGRRVVSMYGAEWESGGGGGTDSKRHHLRGEEGAEDSCASNAADSKIKPWRNKMRGMRVRGRTRGRGGGRLFF